MIGTSATPTAPTERIASLDVLRGVAVLGILFINIAGFAMLGNDWGNPFVSGESDGHLATWITSQLLVEGTMRGIFSLLFGASVIMITSRLEGSGRGDQAADIYYRRTLWLLVFGVVHAYLMLWPGDILYAYGLTGLLLYPMRKLGPRTLIIAGVIVLASMIPRGMVEVHNVRAQRAAGKAAFAASEEGETLTGEQQGALEQWERLQTRFLTGYGPDDHVDRVEQRRSGWWTNFTAMARVNAELQSTDFYRWGLWDALGAMLIGMGLMKLGVFTGDRSIPFYALLLAASYGVGLAVNALELKWIVGSDYDIDAFLLGWVTYDIGRVPTSLGHVCLVMMAVKLGWVDWLTWPLAAVGRMALTNYLAQTVICVLIFYGVGLGLYGRFEWHELLPFVAGIWLVELAWSPIWLRFFRFGPVEWLWRSLTYMKTQPMRRCWP